MSNDIRMKKIDYKRQFQDAFTRMYPELTGPNGGVEDLLVKNITIVLTERCPLRCTYCYECSKDFSKHMTKETAKKAVEFILNDEVLNGYVDSKVTPGVILDFIGGEPFENVEVMDYFCDYFRYLAFEKNHPWGKYYMINITSNGVLLKTRAAEEFITKNAHRLSLTITIDGDKELHDACRIFPDGSGSYDAAIDGLQVVRKYIGVDSTKVTFASENLKYLSTAVPHLFGLGFTTVNANCVFEPGWKPGDDSLFYRELVKLADIIIDNNLYETSYCSIFDDTIGHPMREEENENWCFRAGTMVLTPDGNKCIEDITEGDAVITSDGTIHQVTATLKHVSKDAASIRATGMFKTYTTVDHPYWVKQRIGNHSYTDPHWVSVKDIKPGDKIALQAHQFGTTHVGNGFAYIVGRYIGDGWHSTTGYKLCSSYDEWEELRDVLDTAGIKYSTSDYRTVKQFNIFKSNEALIRILGEIGGNAFHKNIPKSAFQWNRTGIEHMLRGLFDADGTKDNRRVRFNTVSPVLANDVLILLRGLGIAPTCDITRRAGKSTIEGRIVTIRDRYNIAYSTGSSGSNLCVFDTTAHTWWTTVRNVDSNCEPYEVYNLTVGNNHTFVANGAIVHNCGGNARMLAIGTDGNCYPCLRFMKFSLQNKERPEFLIGNLDDGIDGPENQYLTCLCALTRKSQSTTECWNCPVASGCAWCTALHYDLFGDPNVRATYICGMHKARVLANHYYWGKLYEKHGQPNPFVLHLTEEDKEAILSGKGTY